MFSIIVPSYNRKEEIPALLESLTKQTAYNFDVVIVDDCSKEPVEVIQSYPFAVNVIRNETNQGAAESRNIGARNADNEWLLFLDDDDRFANDKCQKLADVIAEHADVNFVYHPAKCEMVNEGFTYVTTPIEPQEISVDRILLANKIGGMPMIGVKKDKNIILIDATNPFGMDDYLPKGRLRESLDALKRADEIIITKSNYASEEEIAKIKERLEKYEKPISVAIFEESYFYKLNFENGKKFGKINNENKIGNEKFPLETIKNKNVLIFSSIANPAVFYQTIKKLKPSNIDEIKFTDHHVYTNEEILKIKEKSQNYDYVLTTEKDIVKIDKNIENLMILKMQFKIVEK